MESRKIKHTFRHTLKRHEWNKNQKKNKRYPQQVRVQNRNCIYYNHNGCWGGGRGGGYTAICESLFCRTSSKESNTFPLVPCLCVTLFMEQRQCFFEKRHYIFLKYDVLAFLPLTEDFPQAHSIMSPAGASFVRGPLCPTGRCVERCIFNFTFPSASYLSSHQSK